MIRALALMFAAVAAGVGCGDNFEAPALPPEQLFVKLRLLPGVTVEEAPTNQPGLHYYILHFTQPIDHQDPSLGSFQQQVALLHRDDRAKAPMIIYTSGYDESTGDDPVELTRLLDANQVSIEHRFFGTSRPEPADWTKLTIEQMAADEHAIIEALHTIYAGAFITTGGSKGGMTAVFHRRFYPDDVDGTVAYVAPISFGAPDTVRYSGVLDAIGPAPCREAVRAAATRMLSARREAMYLHAEDQTQHRYTRIALGAAVESAIVNLEWTFWQYAGVDRCGDVPKADATDEQLFAFLDQFSPVSDHDDDKIAEFEPYYYQSYNQLGFPDAGATYLAPFLYYSEDEYAGELPTPEEPEYDSDSMRDIDFFVENHSSRLLFIYGQWDPWTGGEFLIGKSKDSAVLYQQKGTHMARIAFLDFGDQEIALTKLEAWTGVQPQLSRLQGRAAASEVVARTAGHPVRMPPVGRAVRALKARK
ncbi:MAG TPA: S28 family serine protease [Kofleriaceae bacterium]|nr:S28 family serine protease [Kofleriaceae bacterium]